MPLMTIADYARHRSLERKAIRYAIQNGRITIRPDKLIDSAQADIEWEANTDESKVRTIDQLHPRHVNGHAATTAAATLEVPSEERGTKGSDYAKARAATQVYEARLKKLRYEERAKNLVPAKDVADVAHQTLRCLRDACLNIPARLSAQLAAESDANRIYVLLEIEIGSIFNDFAEGKIT